MENGFSPGQRVGNYEILDVLESSRSGVSYRVRNLVTQRLEALRVIPDVQGDQAKVERFLREVKILAGMSHPNIVRFHTAVELEGRLVMTSELVEGVTLAQRLELGPMAPGEAVDVIAQLMKALEHAHAYGVVHREIAPKNVILTAEGQVKLTGFGMAKQAKDTQLTQMGVPVGSVEYMSPEQVKGMSVPDSRSDIYSAGIVFYEMLTGKTPFASASQFDVMAAHVQTMPALPSSLRAGIGSDLDRVVLTALEKDPARRFQSARQFFDALLPGDSPAQPSAAPASAMPILTPPTEAVAVPDMPVPPTASGMRLLFVGTAVFALTVLLFMAARTFFGS
jgi:eukaryotic-like serine/threonine-protein kinase